MSLTFQTLTWEVIEKESDGTDCEEFKVRCFGKTPKGKSICCTITNFKPFFYVKQPRFDSNTPNRELIPDSSDLSKDDIISKLKPMKSFMDLEFSEFSEE